MLAIGQGSKESIKANIAEMGSNMIMPGTDMRGGVRQSSDDMQKLKPADYESLRYGLIYVKGISPEVSSQGQFINGNNNYPSKVSGVAIDYLDIRKLTVELGLPSSKFMRVHRSFIVQTSKIKIIERNRIVFGKQYIPISDSYKNEFSDYIARNSLSAAKEE